MVTLWICKYCGEEQVSFGGRLPPEEAMCHECRDARRPSSYTEVDAGIPERYRNLTRASWEARFQRTWPACLESWTGVPHWVALWGPTGTGKTAIATILLAEHLRKGLPGHWISGPELSRRIQLDFTNVEAVIAPLLVTPLLVLDEPLTGASADWYTERVVLITRSRDDRGLATILTSQILPELLTAPTALASPPMLSRWLSGIRLYVEGDDIRLKKALLGFPRQSPATEPSRLEQQRKVPTRRQR